MARQAALDCAYMKCAYSVSELSHATRRKVGAIIVSPGGGIIAEGVNGMPSGFDNDCEADEYRIGNYTYHSDIINGLEQTSENTWLTGRHNTVERNRVTRPEVLHAETNAIAKVARSTNSSIGSTLYCTTSPCFHCAKLIIQAGIVRVVYSEMYPVDQHSGQAIGLSLLDEANIQVDRLDLSPHHTHGPELEQQEEGLGFKENPRHFE